MPETYPFQHKGWERGDTEIFGNAYFVNSAHSAARDTRGNGLHPSAPWATMHFANARLAAENGPNHGDVVHVAASHVETVIAASGCVLSTAGVKWKGLQSGARKPQVNFTTAVGANITLSGQYLWMENFLFTGGVDALTGPIDINAADILLRNIETRDVTGQATDFLVTDATADRLVIDGWVHRGAAAAGADTALTIVGGDGIVVRNFWIDGNFAVSAIRGVTTASTNLTLGGGAMQNFIRTRNAACVLVTLHANGTGNIGPGIFGRLLTDAANITEALVGAKMQFFPPLLISNADGEQGFAFNGPTSADA